MLLKIVLGMVVLAILLWIKSAIVGEQTDIKRRVFSRRDRRRRQRKPERAPEEL